MTDFADFAALGRRLERVRGRLEKRDEVARFLKGLAPEEIASAVAFLAARAFPPSDPRVLGVRWLPRNAGGGSGEGPPLTLLEVAEAFADVAGASGAGVRRTRDERLARLAARASADERDFLNRIIGGEMRTGVSEGLLLEAIASAWGLELSAARRAALFLGDLGAVATLAAAGGAAAVSGRCRAPTGRSTSRTPSSRA
jgi:DNA ligase-1